MAFLINDAEINGNPFGKKSELYFIPYSKINLKQTISLK